MVSFRQAVLLLGYALIVHGIAQAVAISPMLAPAQIYFISGVILVGILAFEYKY